jgi:uncharacterized Zn finger protein (UPF0148 family)
MVPRDDDSEVYPVERPCQKCKIPTLARDPKTGFVVLFPTCPSCRIEYAKQHAAALKQAMHIRGMPRS